jgi:ATP-dependent protease ClpP protease subunit
MRRRSLALLALCGAILSAAASAQSPGRGPLYRVPVDGVIELGLAPFIERTLREAEDAGARAVILDIETPGGRVDAAERIVDAVRNSGVPVYAFVNMRAFSAGAMIALSARDLQRSRAVAGEALVRVDNETGRLDGQKLAAQTERSNAEDLDMVDAISKFQNQQTGYDAALKSYSMVQRMSLFQYLS